MATVEKTGRNMAKVRREARRLQAEEERICLTLDGDEARQALKDNEAKQEALRREAEEEVAECLSRS